MVVELTQVLRQLDGTPVQYPDLSWKPKESSVRKEVGDRVIWVNSKTGEVDEPSLLPLTMNKVLVNALMGTYEDEKSLDGSERVARFKLAQKIHGAEKITLVPEDAARIREVVVKMYGTLITGLVYEALEEESHAERQTTEGGGAAR